MKTRRHVKFTDAFPSPYFKAGDLNGTEPIVTMKQISSETMADGTERRCASFDETDKRLILNKTNWAKCAEIAGKDDDSQWAGTKIRLTNRKVNFRGDLVDSIRVDVVDVPF